MPDCAGLSRQSLLQAAKLQAAYFLGATRSLKAIQHSYTSRKPSRMGRRGSSAVRRTHSSFRRNAAPGSSTLVRLAQRMEGSRMKGMHDSAWQPSTFSHNQQNRAVGDALHTHTDVECS